MATWILKFYGHHTDKEPQRKGFLKAATEDKATEYATEAMKDGDFMVDITRVALGPEDHPEEGEIAFFGH